LALDPSLRSEVLKSSSNKCEPLVVDALGSFSNEVILNIIIADFVDNKASVTETRKLIRRLLPKKEKREEMFPVLEKKLLQKGIKQATCSKLIEGRFWADMTTEEKLKHIKENSASYIIDIGLSHEILILIEDLLAEKKFDAIMPIINRVLENLSQEEIDFKIRLIRDFTHVALVLFQSEKYPYKTQLVISLVEKYKNIKESEVKKRFQELTAKLVKTCIENNDFESLPKLISITDYEVLKKDVFGKMSLEDFLKKSFLGKNVNKDLVLNLSKAIGKDAEIALCNILVSIEKDDFDSYRKRQAIALILKDIGTSSEDFLIKNLSSDKNEVILNSLEALSEIGKDKSIPPIEKLLNNTNEKIKKRVKITLEKIKKRIKK